MIIWIFFFTFTLIILLISCHKKAAPITAAAFQFRYFQETWKLT